jgi:hypothetical protein
MYIKKASVKKGGAGNSGARNSEGFEKKRMAGVTIAVLKMTRVEITSIVK